MITTKKQPRTQKLTVLLAYASYLSAIACIVTLYLQSADGVYDSVAASLTASVVFFMGVGIVLHVIGKTDLPSMRLNNDEKE